MNTPVALTPKNSNTTSANLSFRELKGEGSRETMAVPRGSRTEGKFPTGSSHVKGSKARVETRSSSLVGRMSPSPSSKRSSGRYISQNDRSYRGQQSARLNEEKNLNGNHSVTNKSKRINEDFPLYKSPVSEHRATTSHKSEFSSQKRSHSLTPSLISTPLSAPRSQKSGIHHRMSPISSPFPSGDRFIANRSHLNVSLCRASFLSSEKSRADAIERHARQWRLGERGDTAPDQIPTSETLTPLQAEFQRRMRGALLEIPSEELGSHNSRSVSATHRGTINGNSTFVGDENILDLAYMSVPALNASVGNYTQNASTLADVGGGSARMLSFQQKTPESMDLSLSTPKRSRRRSETMSPWSSPDTRRSAISSIDPFSHDQLRVLHRSVAGSSAQFRDSVDPLSLADAGLRSVARSVGRRISASPSRILDAPELVDDYYLNLVSWGKDNILAVALGQCVYLWDAGTGDIKHLLTLQGPDDFVTSVSWAMCDGNTNYIAVGTNESAVQLWDAHALKRVRTLNGHTQRVASLAWNQHWLSSGGRDSLIIQHDVRAENHIASTYTGHTQEVCGLKWNDDGSALASGGNENYLCLWDAAMSSASNNNRNNRLNGHNNRNVHGPRLLLTQHQAAVKALAWCPFHRGLLASGGGTADRTIKFWNTSSGAMLNSVDTGSQVCSLLWSKHQRELCSSHGFSENQLILWRYPNMTKIQEFKGHTARVLHMEQSPDGACVVSAAADETLRFWDVFGSPPTIAKSTTFGIGGGLPGSMSIR